MFRFYNIYIILKLDFCHYFEQTVNQLWSSCRLPCCLLLCGHMIILVNCCKGTVWRVHWVHMRTGCWPCTTGLCWGGACTLRCRVSWRSSDLSGSWYQLNIWYPLAVEKNTQRDNKVSQINHTNSIIKLLNSNGDLYKTMFCFCEKYVFLVVFFSFGGRGSAGENFYARSWLGSNPR